MPDSSNEREAPGQGWFLAGLALVTSCLLALEVLDSLDGWVLMGGQRTLNDDR